jgi:hypothetical protein
MNIWKLQSYRRFNKLVIYMLGGGHFAPLLPWPKIVVFFPLYFANFHPIAPMKVGDLLQRESDSLESDDIQMKHPAANRRSCWINRSKRTALVTHQNKRPNPLSRYPHRMYTDRSLLALEKSAFGRFTIVTNKTEAPYRHDIRSGLFPYSTCFFLWFALLLSELTA